MPTTPVVFTDTLSAPERADPIWVQRSGLVGLV